MGSMTNASIATWQKHAGIEPATGEGLEILEAIAERAVDLIRIVELEKSGIRDGDGNWHASDPIDSTLRELADLRVRRAANDLGDRTPF